MEKLAAVGAAIGLVSWPISSAAENQESKMLVHQVYFWLKDPQDQVAHQSLKAGLKKLLTVSTIESGHIGVPASTEARDVVDNSYSFSYNVRFKNMEDHDSYQGDPIHLEFIETCATLWDKVQVYDYNLV